MTLTLVPHVRHRWAVVLSAGKVQLRCAKCGRSAALDKLGRRVHHRHHREKMVAHRTAEMG